MIVRLWIISLMVVVGGMFSGCTALMIGGAKGYEVKTEHIKVDVAASFDRVYDASLEAIRELGGLSIDKKEEGWVKSEKNSMKVEVHVIKLADNSSRVTVLAQKNLLPKALYARVVLAKILKRVQQQPLWMR